MDRFKVRHIMKLSSHKNEATIKEYAVKCPDNKKREMCDLLSNNLITKHPKNSNATCTVSVNPDQDTDEINNVLMNILSFELQMMDNFDTTDDNELTLILQQTEQEKLDMTKKTDTEALQVTSLVQKSNPLQALNQNKISPKYKCN